MCESERFEMTNHDILWFFPGPEPDNSKNKVIFSWIYENPGEYKTDVNERLRKDHTKGEPDSFNIYRRQGECKRVDVDPDDDLAPDDLDDWYYFSLFPGYGKYVLIGSVDEAEYKPRNTKRWIWDRYEFTDTGKFPKIGNQIHYEYKIVPILKGKKVKDSGCYTVDVTASKEGPSCYNVCSSERI